MITQAVNLLDWISSGKFTRELNKESLLNQSPIYTKYTLSQIRYSLVVILELIGVSEVQYKGVMMIDDGKYQ